MEEFPLFAASIALSFCAWIYICVVYLWPRLRLKSQAEAFRSILVLHLFRFVGLSFLFSGVAGPSLPKAFSILAAYGDLLAVVLAWLALLLLYRPGGIAVLWVFNLWGATDLLLAFFQGITRADFHPSSLGATFYIPTFYVPLLLCTHGMLLALLIRPAKESPRMGLLSTGPVED